MSVKQQLLDLLQAQQVLIRKLDSLLPHSTTQQQQNVFWTQNEHNQFIQLVNKLGKNKISEIARNIPGKNKKQVATHSQKFFNKLKMNVRKYYFGKENEDEKVLKYLQKNGLEGIGLKQVLVQLQM
ncbi:Myb-like_DNA-binding domain-containing protein [Hexamita inflata]|uniref:Myb-like DNA-binding domain-containing protein n=1 Tax=Hexamita inflata TaxID=28002 RepID=A0AA86PBF8_9EUKA|nr:Myb-like DNA-binding domain-containing protein [Hexamita inflata]CAI9934686.1 Myb-like DNA-binding domain-containing protein [Hexamita inflata]